MTARLTSLFELLDALPGARLAGAPADGVGVADVTHDSRTAGPGVLLACRPGATADGHDFAPQAVAAGTPALLVQRVLDLGVPQLVVADVAAALGPAAATVHGHPSTALTLLGVTGTSGKTTTTYLLESILRAAGNRTGMIGTISGARTTPEATDLQRLLRGMVDRGVSAVAMEVSSHGLALGRVAGTRFAAAAFTNLSHDHLDFHPDMASYEAAKASLFTPRYTGRAVLNVDDPAGRRMAAAARGLELTTVSAQGQQADVTASDVHLTARGSTFTAHLVGQAVDVALRLPGAFNVANALLALATARAAGIGADVSAAGLAQVGGVPGRMEAVEAGQPFAVLVDYAHKPDAVENVLRTARRLTGGRVIVVLGCGGDRDPGKRPLMGRVAAELADLAVFTDDNPRREDPAAIRAALLAGARQIPGARWTEVAERRAAIAAALDAAQPGDVVVIAGKGHETYQEVAGVRHPFDDREVARALLATRAVRRPASGAGRMGHDAVDASRPASGAGRMGHDAVDASGAA
jgi:UDP-N-acetylmuramoyl-L-alanyl-D-glutamate--2,6-diaminopimelate ligase